ncbi:phosphate acyltransferase PlsX [Nitrosococcus oceani]|uniref:Phosphate acyltransferase n=2 Tax=Nitrosococcus oceani TaxID=1229 RepID=PLSX_NITOC|nr:phosphate acyltransferase PlsX [Nitrosococcus oceani]Q3JAK6.1 RecName: Full=Phosphate acyltransferase; AltName: Full=Acyl-ACP phosphotransacylase; AltName: Full=Acyl-[acyl-carrier-protein]--phosphate acyltransferase; AltName: Full=Phosphate-acyl-ACP acyltransferase [Nitrosococcus oceani ATCC 19707]ABA58140.1 phosphate:acyl-[acyl carrier protein] acyltransferase [Nitrosococcus oceani ATCC 19707]GEM21314.1 phosphate acyltransferase [Nitrosococcus oceani]
MSVTIALDAMGGDHGPQVVVPAALKVLAEMINVKLILIGDRDLLNGLVAIHRGELGTRLTIQHASQKVEMDEAPSQALRAKKDSSMRIAINLVKSRKADACVSAGNTGALMAIARFVLKTLPGIDRPAIVSALPTIRGHCYMLDLGANVDSSAQNLYQFALMGSVLASAIDNIKEPSVGLLNIGSEIIKGNERIKEAGRMLSQSHLNYVGFVEGNDVYEGCVDVVVCDGFVGNVALKSSEGVARMVRHYLRESFQRNYLTRFAGFLALPVLKAFHQRMDPRRYNGANLLGLNGVVIKSHGGADITAFAHAIRIAVIEARKDVPQHISAHLEPWLSEGQVV